MPQDQVAGWNWDLGTITQSATVEFAIAANSDLPSLVDSLEAALPDSSGLIFADGFESGDTWAWEN